MSKNLQQLKEQKPNPIIMLASPRVLLQIMMIYSLRCCVIGDKCQIESPGKGL